MTEATELEAPQKQSGRQGPPEKLVAPDRKARPFTIKDSQFQQAEYGRSTFTVTLPAGTHPEILLTPETYSLIAHRLAVNVLTRSPDRSGSIIQADTEDRAWYAELYVRAVLSKGLVVSMLPGFPVYFGIKEVPSDQYKIKWNTKLNGFDIIRASDDSIVASGLKTKEIAKGWIERGGQE